MVCVHCCQRHVTVVRSWKSTAGEVSLAARCPLQTSCEQVRGGWHRLPQPGSLGTISAMEQQPSTHSWSLCRGMSRMKAAGGKCWPLRKHGCEPLMAVPREKTQLVPVCIGNNLRALTYCKVARTLETPTQSVSTGMCIGINLRVLTYCEVARTLETPFQPVSIGMCAGGNLRVFTYCKSAKTLRTFAQLVNIGMCVGRKLRA